MPNLEESRFFPLIAWTLIIGFCCGTLFLTTSLYAEIQKLEQHIENTSVHLD